MSGSTATIQSVARAVAILRAFTEAEPELGVSELSRRLALSKSTVTRILKTLEREGLVSQNPATSKYRLGLGLISLAGVALGRLDVRGAAQPHLNALVEASGETVNVTVLDGDECVNVERLASPKPIRYVGWIGRRTPTHCTAAGKVLLAYLPPAKRRAGLRLPLQRYTDKTVVDAACLDASLLDVRRQGYAITHEEFEVDSSTVAAPVFAHDGAAVAAITVTGPTYRMSQESINAFLALLLQTAQTVSAQIGYRGHRPQPMEREI